MAGIHALTLRLPEGLVRELRAEALARGTSLNELARGVLAEHTARRDALGTLREVGELRGQLEAEHGAQPDSVPLLRAMRRGEERR